MQDGKVIFVTGKRGSGKTTWLKNEIDRQRRVLVWDWRGEYSLPPIQLPELLTVLHSDSFCRSYRPNYHADLLTQFNQLAYAILHMASARNFSLVIDEAYLVCPGPNDEGELGKLIRLTRPKNINLYLSSQRPCKVPGIFRSEADEWKVFALHNPPDLQVIREMFGEPVAIATKKLEQFQYLSLSC